MNVEYQVDMDELAAAAVRLKNIGEYVADQCRQADYDGFAGWTESSAAGASKRLAQRMEDFQAELLAHGESHPATLALIARKYTAQEADASQAIKTFFEGRLDQ